MKNELNLADLSSPGEMKLIKDSPMGTELTAYLHLDPGFAELLNFKSIITPFSVNPLDKGINRYIKRATDIIFAMLIILFVLSWLIPVIALLIIMDSKGPVFFVQKRNKRNGELFSCLKFRTMIVNADADIMPAGREDKRITRIGRFLRNHYLDELPQFFNVLMGDMSVIGPRPHMVSDNINYDQQVKNYAYRHNVKPGITGLAQVMGYVGLIDDQKKLEARVNIDIFYVRHWSSKMDLIILYRTLKKIAGLKTPYNL